MRWLARTVALAIGCEYKSRYSYFTKTRSKKSLIPSSVQETLILKDLIERSQITDQGSQITNRRSQIANHKSQITNRLSLIADH